MVKNYFRDLRNQSIASLDENATTILEYELEKQKKGAGLTGAFACSRGAVILISNIIGLGLLAVIGVAVGLAVSSAISKNYGSSCTQNSDCITLSTYGLICNNGNCSCIDTAYFDGSTCVAKKGYQVPCNSLNKECNDTKVLTCISSSTGYICGCTDDRWWNGQMCELLNTYNESCTNVNQCQPNLNFICNKTCTCTDNYYWTGVKCDSKKLFNGTCTSSTICDSSKSLYCSTTGSLAGYCVCNNQMFWDTATSTCVAHKSNSQGCSDTSQCRTDLGLSCLSLSCSCASNFYWSGSTCTKRRTSSASCSATVPCDDTLLLVCTSSTCGCPSTHYWDGLGCTPKLSIGASCSSGQCLDISGLSCTTFCSCTSTYFWNSTTCVPKYLNLVGCISTLQCREDLLLSCTSSSCQCAYTHYWSGSVSGCLIRKTYTETCSYTDMCRTYLGLECRSSPMQCLCAVTHYWDGTTCQLKKEYTNTCTGISGECNDVGRYLYCPTSVGSNVANCPTTSSTRFCDCQSGQFYDNRSGGSNTCVSLLLNGIACTMHCQCSSTAGLTCQSNTCQCANTDTQYWDSSSSICRARRTNGQSCSATVPCLVVNGLSCQSTQCACLSTHYWDGSNCQLKLEYGVTCTGITGQCNNARNLYCPTSVGSNVANCPTTSSTRFCDCQSGQFYDNRSGGSNTCISRLLNGIACTMHCQCSSTAGLTCQSNTCQCANTVTQYWDGSTCQSKRSNGQSCSGTVPCLTSAGLSCSGTTCSCASTHYWDGSNCQVKLGYGVSCSTSFTGQCDGTKGLYCPSTVGSNVASCPTSSSSRFCDCQSGQFFDNRSGGSYTCVSLLSYGSYCTTNCQCSSSLGLSCQSNSCQCSSGWSWSSTVGSCATTSSSSPSACENDYVSLSCWPYQIYVTDAFYGRIDSRCSGWWTTSCSAGGVLSYVQAICNGQTSCGFFASNGVFGDPCSGTQKYGYATYICY